MPQHPSFYRLFLTTITEELSKIGLEKRREGIFTCPISDEVIGFVGLPHVIHGPTLQIDPIVGARHQLLEREWASLLEKPFHPYVSPSFACALGYLSPERRWKPWDFESERDINKHCPRLGRAIRQFGFPFMRANSTLAALLNTMLHCRHGNPLYLPYRIPLAYCLLNEKEKARQVLEEELAKLGKRSDGAALQYFRFAGALRRTYFSGS